MSRRLLPVVVVLGAALVLASACSGSSSGASSPSGSAPSGAVPSGSAASAAQPPPQGALAGNQVENQAKAAFQGASAVHINGTLTSQSGTLTMDLQLNKDNTATGSISEGGATIPLLSVGGKYYVRFTPAVITAAGSAATSVGPALTNKWVPSTSKLASGMVDSLKGLLSYNDFLTTMFGQPSGEVPKATTTDVVDNTPVIVYEASSGSAVYLAKSNPHFLMRMTAPSSGSGQIDFTNWNKPVPVHAPTAAQIYSGPAA
jgi:hypothetical protein